jgi:SOS response regulatory protein OraA/RecX
LNFAMTDIAQLETRLTELRGERAAVESTMTKEDLARNVDEWIGTARAQAAGASRLVLGGSNASGEHLERVLHEDRLDDDGLAERTVARLERQGFGALSDRQKGSKLKALDEKIAKATGELREARKRQALEEVERQFAGEAA